MRKTRLLLLLLFYTIPLPFLRAQTPIKGIINTYHKVENIINAKSCVVVDDATGLGPGDRVMLVQMKGAGIVTSPTRTTAFGDTTSLYNAGNYELGTVCYVNEDSVFLLHTIIRSYTLTGKVQLVSIPVYDNAVVVDSLKAKHWSNSEGKGGVLALSVTYSLFLNAPVSATGSGFAGGSPVLSSGDCANYFVVADGPYYDASRTQPQNGAYKGESVYDIADPDYTGGMAAIANGGGGGNNHNNGGGGGANLSAGGSGGGNNSAAGCFVSNPGGGGKALRNYGGAKIFLGGGGGAGHINNAEVFFEGGGNGGGIIYLQAQTLVSSGHTVSANGAKGGQAKGDGAAGGGGGGTIIMNVQLYNDPARIEAKGGDGGQEDDNLHDKRCYGEGGGGSGGVVYFRGSAPSGVSVNGGVNGLKINGLNCGTPVPGSPGAAGVTATAYSPLQSTTISSSCTFVLPATLLYFRASVAHRDVTTGWQVGQPEYISVFVVERKQDGEGWKEIGRVVPREGADTYSAIDKDLPAGSFLYRLKIIGKQGTPLYSPQQRVTVAVGATLTVYPNPTRGRLYIQLPPGAGKELRIYDLSGRLLLEKRLNTNSSLVTQDVSGFREGLYILRIGVLQKLFSIR
jgi:hypothetical protein